MLKGLNRNVIEVSNIKNSCFERAVLILKPEYENLDDEKLLDEYRHSLFDKAPPSFVKKNRAVFLISNLISGTAGALISAAILLSVIRFV